MSKARKPPLEALSFANLDRLGNGQAGEAIRRAVEVCVADLDEYGDDGLARKIVVEVAIKRPGKGTRVEILFAAKAVTPRPTVTKTVGEFEASAGSPRLLFNPLSAANVGQLSLVPGDGCFDEGD